MRCKRHTAETKVAVLGSSATDFVLPHLLGRNGGGVTGDVVENPTVAVHLVPEAAKQCQALGSWEVRLTASDQVASHRRGRVSSSFLRS